MIICVCHRVSDRDIAHAVRLGGCTRFDDLQRRLGVATSCGACFDCARQSFESLVPPAADGTPSTGHEAPAVRDRALAPVARSLPASVASPGTVASADGPAPAGRWTRRLQAGA